MEYFSLMVQFCLLLVAIIANCYSDHLGWLVKPASQWKIATVPSVQTPSSNTPTSPLKTASNFSGLKQSYIYFHLDKDKQCLLNITFRLISCFFVLFLSLLIKSCSFSLKLYVTDWLTDWMRRWEFFISALSCWRRRWSDLDAAKQNPNKWLQWEEDTKTAQASIN